MPQVQGPRKQTQGLQDPIITLNPSTFQNTRVAPGTNQHAEQGTLWIQPRDISGAFVGGAFLNVGNNGGLAQWLDLAAGGGGAGEFTSLVVTPGPISLTGTTDINTIGSSITSIGSGGGLFLGSEGNGNIFIGNGESSASIFIATGGPITVGSGDGSSSITIGAAAMTGLINIGPSGAAQTIAIGASDVGAKNILIGEGSAANDVSIGSNAGGAETSIRAGTGGISFDADGIVEMDSVAATSATPTATVIINANVGVATFTGFTTASAASQVFTITNSLATTTSRIFVSAANEGANDAQMTVARVNRDAGSVAVTLTNNGAAALNGNVSIAFWIIGN